MIRVITADDQALVRGGIKMILEAQPDSTWLRRRLMASMRSTSQPGCIPMLS
jgi:hypothetical protein